MGASNDGNVAEGLVFLSVVTGVGVGMISRQWLAEEPAFGVGLVTAVLAFFVFAWLISRR